MSIFSSSKPATRSVAVFDISSGSIGGAHATIEKGHAIRPVTCTASKRIHLQMQPEIQIDRFFKQMIAGIERVAEELRKMDDHQPTFVQCILSSPWYVSQTRKISYKKDTPFVFTEQLLEEIIQQEIKHLVANELDQFGSFGKEGKIIERQISVVKLNGYVSHQPFGHHATEVEVYLTITLTPEAILTRLKEVLEKHYHDAAYGFTTAPYTTYIVQRDYFTAFSELGIIDVGEEITDLAFVKDGLFLYHHSFPMGTNGLLRTLLTQGSHSVAESYSLLAAYRNNHLAAPAKNKVAKALATFQQEWQKGLQQVFEEGHFGFALPSHFLITADPHYETVFQEAIEHDPLVQYLIAHTKPQVQFISNAMLGGMVRGVVPDVPVSVGVLFVDRQW